MPDAIIIGSALIINVNFIFIMSNNYFRFKKFIVYHDLCAMKVGTDGVLLGAWTNIENVSTVLDVGTGTGLISMMIAQRLNDSKIKIDAIEIDRDAVNQANKNIVDAELKNISVYNISLQEYEKYSNMKYDLIVANPPYFISSLQSSDDKRTLARHTASLSMEELLGCAIKLLSSKGRLSVIYPYEYKSKLVNLADQFNLNVIRITNVYPTPTSQPKRILVEFTLKKSCFQEDNLVIELRRHIYSSEYIELVKDFYLKM